MSWTSLAMKAFIAAVIVLGFFGPYVISVLLGGLCLAIWYYCRSEKDATGGKS